MCDFLGSIISRWLCALGVLLFIPGCSSVITHTTSYEHIGNYLDEDLSRVSRTYSGFCLGIGMITRHNHNDSKSETLALLGFYDMAMSGFLDTALLPIDLSMDTIFYFKNGYYPDWLCERVK